MVIHTININIPKGQMVSIKFIERIKKIYDEEQKNFRLGNKDKLRLNIKINNDKSSKEFSSFQELNSEILPEKIDSLEINFFNGISSKNFLSFSLRIDNEHSFLSKIEIKGKNEETINRIRKKIQDIFIDFRTNHRWLYSLGRFPIYSISFIFSISFSILVFQILKNIAKLDGGVLKILISLLIFPIIFIFAILSYKIISWLFPEVNFELREMISNNKKIIRYILGVIGLSLLVNFIWVIGGLILK